MSQPGAKFVLVALANFADENGFCFPSQATLARMTNIAERTVRAHLKYLEEEIRLIRREERRNQKGQMTSDGFHLLGPAERFKPSRSVQRQDLPAADSTVGKICQNQRQNLPAAKSARDTSVKSDEPSREPPKTLVEPQAASTPRATSRVAQAQEAFRFWQETFNSPRSVFDVKRQRAVEARLKEGYTLDDIKRAIRGITKSPFNMGDNDRHSPFRDIELICRNGSNLERFMALDPEAVRELRASRPPPKSCTLCHGTGQMKRLNSNTFEDETVPCRCNPTTKNTARPALTA